VYSFCRCIRGLLGDCLVVLVTHQVQFALQADKILALKDVSVISYCVPVNRFKILIMIGQCLLPLQGKVDAYGSQSELISQGVDPTHLLGLMKKKKEERDEFAYEDEGEEEEEKKGT